eukprot:gene24244-29441_t
MVLGLGRRLVSGLAVDLSPVSASFDWALPGPAAGEPKKQQMAEVRLLDHKRSQMGSIALAPFKVSFEEIRHALETYDQTVLSLDQAMSLKELYPTPDEIKGDEETLGRLERFMLELLKMPGSFQLHMHTYIYMAVFEDEADKLRRNLQDLIKACKCILASEGFKQVMMAALQVGNFLNAGTTRSNAAGFPVSCLKDIVMCKSQQFPSMNLLDMILYLLGDSALALPDELADLALMEKVVRRPCVVTEKKRKNLSLKNIGNKKNIPPGGISVVFMAPPLGIAGRPVTTAE